MNKYLILTFLIIFAACRQTPIETEPYETPKTASGKISFRRYEKLVLASQETLQKAIAAGGSSLRDFVNSDGKPGYFQQQYWVYGRSGQTCRKCSGVIKQIKQGQRSSFYCTRCQR